MPRKKRTNHLETGHLLVSGSCELIVDDLARRLSLRVKHPIKMLRELQRSTEDNFKLLIKEMNKSSKKQAGQGEIVLVSASHSFAFGGTTLEMNLQVENATESSQAIAAMMIHVIIYEMSRFLVNLLDDVLGDKRQAACNALSEVYGNDLASGLFFSDVPLDIIEGLASGKVAVLRLSDIL